MLRCAHTGRRVGQLPGFGLEQRDEFLDAGCRDGIADHQCEISVGEVGDRCEIAIRVPRKRRVYERIEDDRTGGEEQGIAVRRRPGDDLRADVAGGAGAIFDHDGLSKPLGELRRDRARNDVLPRAGSEGNNEPDRLRRPFLGLCFQCGDAEGANKKCRCYQSHGLAFMKKENATATTGKKSRPRRVGRFVQRDYFGLSRNSRRRILPTGVLGSSVRNSTILGTL